MSDGWRDMPDGQPRDCCICAQPILISKQSCGFKTYPPLRSWHTACTTMQRPNVTLTGPGKEEAA